MVESSRVNRIIIAHSTNFLQDFVRVCFIKEETGPTPRMAPVWIGTGISPSWASRRHGGAAQAGQGPVKGSP